MHTKSHNQPSATSSTGSATVVVMALACDHCMAIMRRSRWHTSMSARIRNRITLVSRAFGPQSAAAYAAGRSDYRQQCQYNQPSAVGNQVHTCVRAMPYRHVPQVVFDPSPGIMTGWNISVVSSPTTISCRLDLTRESITYIMPGTKAPRTSMMTSPSKVAP